MRDKTLNKTYKVSYSKMVKQKSNINILYYCGRSRNFTYSTNTKFSVFLSVKHLWSSSGVTCAGKLEKKKNNNEFYSKPIN